MNSFTIKRDVTFFLYDDLELTDEMKTFLRGYEYGMPERKRYIEVYKVTDEENFASAIVDGQEIVIY